MSETDKLTEAAQHLQAESASLIEAMRLRRIADMNLVKRKLDQCFNDFTLIAALACDMPYASITIIDDAHSWVKAGAGSDTVRVMPRENSFSSLAIEQPAEATVIPDTLLDPRVANINPWVISGDVRFYAGAPLLTGNGLALGALSVVDSKPSQLSVKQIGIMKSLARLISVMLGDLPIIPIISN